MVVEVAVCEIESDGKKTQCNANTVDVDVSFGIFSGTPSFPVLVSLPFLRTFV